MFLKPDLHSSTYIITNFYRIPVLFKACFWSLTGIITQSFLHSAGLLNVACVQHGARLSALCTLRQPVLRYLKHVCTGACVGGQLACRGQCRMSGGLCHSLHWGLETQSLTGQQTLRTLLSPPHNAGVIGTQLRPAFYVGGGDLNSGPHACRASAPTPGLSSQF